jgi:hypothetical protein
MSKKRKLTLYMYPPHEMAEIKEGRYSIFLGNYWDFHAGCYGTKLPMKDDSILDLTKDWKTGQGPEFLVNLIARKIGADVEVKERKTPIPC